MRDAHVTDAIDWTAPVATESMILPTPQNTTATSNRGQLTFDDLTSSSELEETTFTPLVFVPIGDADTLSRAIETGRRIIIETNDEGDDNSLYHISEKLPPVSNTEQLTLGPNQADSLKTYVKTTGKLIKRHKSTLDEPDNANKYAQTLWNLEEVIDRSLTETWERLLRAVETTSGVALKFTHKQISPSYLACPQEADYVYALTSHSQEGTRVYGKVPAFKRSLFRFWLAQAFAYSTDKSCSAIGDHVLPEPTVEYTYSSLSESEKTLPNSAKSSADLDDSDSQVTLDAV